MPTSLPWRLVAALDEGTLPSRTVLTHLADQAAATVERDRTGRTAMFSIVVHLVLEARKAYDAGDPDRGAEAIARAQNWTAYFAVLSG